MGFIKPSSGSGEGGGSLTPQQESRLNNAYSHAQSNHAPLSAEENVQADWNETDKNSDAYIRNKPAISNNGDINLAVYGTDLSLDNNNTLKLKNSDGEEIGIGVTLPSGGGSGDGFETISSTPILTLESTTIKNSWVSSNKLFMMRDLPLLNLSYDKRYVVDFLGKKQVCSLAEGKNLACNFETIFVSIEKYQSSQTEYATGVIIQTPADAEGNQVDISNMDLTDLVLYEEEVTIIDSKYLDSDLKLINSIGLGRVGTAGTNSCAIGYVVEASGKYSHAEGAQNHSLGSCSHTEGVRNIASGTNSHAEGAFTKAKGTDSHSEGYSSIASGYGSHSEGYGSTASGDISHAEGESTIASSKNQHVEGRYNIEDTENKYAHIVGNGIAPSQANNWTETRSNAHTLDWDGNAWYKGTVSCDGTPTNDNDLITKAYFEANKGGSVDLSGYAPIDSPDFTGDISMRRKSGTTVGIYSISLGDDNEASGGCSCAMGYGCVASKLDSFAFGNRVRALSDYQCVQGSLNELDSEKKYIHIIGNGKLDYDGKEVRSNAYTLDWEGNGWFKGNVSIDGTPTADNHLINKKYVDDAILQATTGGEIDLSSYAKSDNPVFTGALSMYRKSGTTVGQYSVALGSNATASGKKSVAIGDNVTASGSASFACGAMCTASGSLSHAEGFYCTAGADSSHAEGCLTQALGQQSHSEGNNTIANCNFQHVQGTFNIKDEDGIYAHIIGNGTADNARANIHTVAWDGKGWFKGDVYVGGTSQADGKKLLSTADIYFDTDGNLCVTINGTTKKFTPMS